jgi:hypothetical protein
MGQQAVVARTGFDEEREGNKRVNRIKQVTPVSRPSVRLSSVVRVS